MSQDKNYLATKESQSFAQNVIIRTKNYKAGRISQDPIIRLFNLMASKVMVETTWEEMDKTRNTAALPSELADPKAHFIFT